jgi:hypothetical protein
MSDEIKRGMELPRPGPEHRVFEKDVGDWQASVEVRPPGAAAQVSTGISRNRLICGGLWLVVDFRNEASGFEGHGLYGWDPRRRAYVGTWVDPTRTFLTVGEGAWDEARRTMTFRYTAPRPDGGTLAWREVTETRDDGSQVMRSLMPAPDGGEHEMMTITYRRLPESG